MTEVQEAQEPQAPQEPQVVAGLRSKFGDAVLEFNEALGELTIVVARDRIVDVCTFLRDDPEHRYDLLSDLTAVDWLPKEREPRFQIVYHLLSIPNNQRLRLKIGVEEDEPIAPSVVSVWPTANWLEREVYDMYGIRFANHPDLRRILMPDDWPTYPLRKDVPLGEEVVEFSQNIRPQEP